MNITRPNALRPISFLLPPSLFQLVQIIIYHSPQHCQLWTGSGWEVVSPLLQRRWQHGAWPTEDGLLLIGNIIRIRVEHSHWSGFIEILCSDWMRSFRHNPCPSLVQVAGVSNIMIPPIVDSFCACPSITVSDGESLTSAVLLSDIALRERKI